MVIKSQFLRCAFLEKNLWCWVTPNLMLTFIISFSSDMTTHPACIARLWQMPCSSSPSRAIPEPLHSLCPKTPQLPLPFHSLRTQSCSAEVPFSGDSDRERSVTLHAIMGMDGLISLEGPDLCRYFSQREIVHAHSFQVGKILNGSLRWSGFSSSFLQVIWEMWGAQASTAGSALCLVPAVSSFDSSLTSQEKCSTKAP